MLMTLFEKQVQILLHLHHEFYTTMIAVGHAMAKFDLQDFVQTLNPPNNGHDA